jgi:hypothetical protein
MNGEDFPTLTLPVQVANRREGQVIKNLLKRTLNIDVDVATKDSPVLLDEFLAMRWDLIRIGSGGDFDPDDGIVDWMQTASKFNGTKRNKTPTWELILSESRSFVSRAWWLGVFPGLAIMLLFSVSIFSAMHCVICSMYAKPGSYCNAR